MVKNQITINFNWDVTYKPPHSTSKKNDYVILKIKHPVLSKELMIFYDLWYLGAGKNFPEQTAFYHTKKVKMINTTSKRIEPNSIFHQDQSRACN